MRIRTVIVAGVLALAGGGTANALASPVETGATGDARYGCGGVDPVAGICLNSPLDTLEGPLDSIGGLLR